MRIIRLKINNVLNLKAIDVRPSKHVNKVSGKNGAGKSNFLETIRFALLGKRVMPKQPIRNGAKKGGITVELDNHIVEVRLTENGEYWNVTDKEGRPIKSPQAFLKELVGPISFDPLALLDDDDKKLRALLLDLVGVNLDDFDTKIKKVYEERTIIGRRLKEANALLDNCTYHEDTPKEEQGISELNTKLNDAISNNQRISNLSNIIDHNQTEIERLEAEIEGCKQAKLNALAELRKLQVIDTKEITQQMENLEATNKKVRDNQKYIEYKNIVEAKQDDYDGFTNKIEELEAQKDKALKEAKMPVPGLGVDENGVTYTDEKNGTRPLSQVNTAKRIEIGMALYMAKNPELKVMFIDANACDKETEEAIEKAVKDADFQVFCEEIDGESGIYLVDGTVKE